MKLNFLYQITPASRTPWLGGYRPQIPVLSVLCPQLNLLNPLPPRTKFLGTSLVNGVSYTPFHGVAGQQASWTTWPSKIKTVGFIETSGTTYPTTQRHIPHRPESSATGLRERQNSLDLYPFRSASNCYRTWYYTFSPLFLSSVMQSCVP